MTLTILSHNETLFQGRITSLTCPGVEGSFQILNNHMPLISLLQAGVVTYKTEGETHHTTISGGLLKVEENNLLLLTE